MVPLRFRKRAAITRLVGARRPFGARANAASSAPAEREPAFEREHRVSPLELFFDLVFVFGFTQVTTLLHEDATWGGLARAMLALAVLWWAWATYAWLTNTLNPDEGLVTATMLVATAAMFLAALALPEAFG